MFSSTFVVLALSASAFADVFVRTIQLTADAVQILTHVIVVGHRTHRYEQLRWWATLHRILAGRQHRTVAHRLRSRLSWHLRWKLTTAGTLLRVTWRVRDVWSGAGFIYQARRGVIMAQRRQSPALVINTIISG